MIAFTPRGKRVIAVGFAQGFLLLGTVLQGIAQTCPAPVPRIRLPNLPPNDEVETETSSSIDPNEKRGPTGFGAANFLAYGGSLPYRIKFENFGPGSVDSSGAAFPARVWASAPAQEVEISDSLSPTLDWSTLRFSGFGFGGTLRAMNPPASFMQTVLPVTIDGRSFDVHFEASLDLATGRLRAVFRSIDPQTSLPPDVLTGFLPPEDGTGRGQGFIEYTVQPRSGLPSGTEIRNVALISFDRQPAISTDQIDPLNAAAGVSPDKQALVTLDADVPSSVVMALPPTVPTPDFLVSWAGSDGGSGIASFDVFVSPNGGPWILWQSGVTNTEAVFGGEHGSTYAFYSVARDNVGHVEPAPEVEDARTRVDVAAVPPVVLNTAMSLGPDGHPVLVLSFAVHAGRSHTVEYRDDVSLDSEWIPLAGAPHNSGMVVVTEVMLTNQRYYRLRVD